ncbi:hypothetical protein GCM10010218_01980 [Streptomyces mashuensis]|uniref:Peptide zinc metalloprotease protein n=1 Tax=Streptomyces mashuensis TaxID=33904 RepID=A0A919ASL5_9ACTN|nr:hypothetical protein [Streptomyces mashuensis]GHF24927.1 hypothetical protein GCM10010218_01980 [Streptomyces mashuensis]
MSLLPSAPRPARLGEPAPVPGTELVGEFEDSGYREPPHLVCRSDGQIVRLPPLLYQALRALAQAGPGPAVAERVAVGLSRETGRRFSAEHVAFLLDKKLAPLGLTTYADGSPPPPVTRKDPFLAFRFRLAVVPEHVTWWLSGLFAWLFRPAVVLLALGAFSAAETWLWLTQDTSAALWTVLSSPGDVLLVVALAVASCAFHELGHGAACRYGGVRPGAMGCGLYLVWPAFYTDITNSYRLGRAGRIRADLGGVYFNGLFVLGLVALYVGVGSPLLLVAILSVHLEMVQQLLPTLRFDGYYIVADLVGIPDLFKYIGPILKRVVLRRPADEQLRALKRWPQVVVAAWVLLLVPVLALQLGMVLFNLPQVVTADWQKITALMGSAVSSGSPVLSMAAACVQTVLLVLPLVGVGLVLGGLVRSLIRLARRRRHSA